MRPENILAWSVGVEFGAPPPSQPPFDQFGNPVVNVAANVKEWKREFQAQQAERKTHERGFRQQKVVDMTKTGSANPDVEAYIKDWRGAGMGQEREGEERERTSRQRNPSTPKTGPSRFDVEAHWNHVRSEQADQKERERMQKILFPHTVPKEHPKPEPKFYRIPQRKPVPKSNDATPRPPPTPQVVLLRNGERKRVENIASYAERVRELGYPEVLCPLPMKEIDCTGAKVVKQKDVRQDWEKDEELGRLGDRDGSQPPQNQLLTPEMLSLSGEFRTLKLGQKRL